ncbi:MAG: nitroreductase family protein [Coriobacteriales bacterium]|jgi:nitroreductase
MTFLDLAAARWTCRKYASTPVEQEKIDAILEAVRLSPSSKNTQGTHVWVLQSAEAMERIKECTTSIYGAPLAFILGYNPAEPWVRPEDDLNFGMIDTSIAGTYLILEAYEQGLCSTWVGAYSPAKLRELFPEIEGYEDVAIFSVGYPAEDAKPAPLHTNSKTLDEMVTVL